MTRIEILTEQAKGYDEGMLLEAMDMATDADEVRVLELELDARTNPFLNAKTERSLLGDLLAGRRIF